MDQEKQTVQDTEQVTTVQITEPVGKTENFFTRHVKLIAFLITIGVLLAVFIPIAIWDGRDYLDEDENLPKMTTEDLIVLIDRKNTLTMEDFMQFSGTTLEQLDGTYYYITIEPHYSVMVRHDVHTGKIDYCTMQNSKNGETFDLLSDDVDLRTYFENRP